MPHYFVIDPTGERYGPVDTDTLRRWVDERRISPDWLVAEEESGKQMPVSSVLPPVNYEVPPVVTAQPVQPMPMPGYSQYPRGAHNADAVDGQSWNNAGIIVSGIAIFSSFCACAYVGVPLGIAGVVCGFLARKRDAKSGKAGIIMGSIAIILSIITYILLRQFFLDFASQFKHMQ